MSRSDDYQSGPDNTADVLLDEQGQILNDGDDSDLDVDTRRGSANGSSLSSASQQVNRVRQMAHNAQIAASAATLSRETSRIDVTAEGRDLQLATLVARNRRTAAELVKRERELAERERALLADA
jgi:hypothetical protein